MSRAEMDTYLHRIARDTASFLLWPDKKQLRLNEIVRTARDFYPNHEGEGVRELVESCDRIIGFEPCGYGPTTPIENALYVKGSPMWESLQKQYGWMKGDDGE